MQQLHPDDGPPEENDDVPGMFRGEVIVLPAFRGPRPFFSCRLFQYKTVMI
jgi:hypothetical protein